MFIHLADLARFHKAARMIEDDLDEAYKTCRLQFGADVAGVLLVAALRDKLNDKKNQWPPPEDLFDKVNQFLADKGLLDDSIYPVENIR